MAENARGTDETSLRVGTPAGSLRYFAVLFADAERRDTLHAHYALEYALRDAAASENHDVAHTRLQWWREESAPPAAGQPRHPATVALSAGNGLVPDALLRSLITAAELDLARFAYADWRSEEHT